MTAIVGNSVNTGDAAFGSVSVCRQLSQPLPRLPCQTASRNILKPPHRAVCCLVLWPLPLQGCDAACFTFSQGHVAQRFGNRLGFYPLLASRLELK